MPRPWKHFIDLHDIWQEESFDFELRRDKIIERIESSTAWDENDEDICDLLDQLSYTENEDWFDEVWSCIYDWADDKRVWIELWTPVVRPVKEDLERLLTELKGP